MCQHIAAGETLNQIASEPGMPSRSTIDRWRTDRPEFKRQYDIAVQLRADGLLEETIDIIDDKKEIISETTTTDERGEDRSPGVHEGRPLLRDVADQHPLFKISKMLPRKWGNEGHGFGEPAPAQSRRRQPRRTWHGSSVSTRSKNRSWRGSASPMRRRRRRKHEARHRSGFSRCLPVRPLCPSRDGGAASKGRLMRGVGVVFPIR